MPATARVSGPFLLFGSLTLIFGELRLVVAKLDSEESNNLSTVVLSPLVKVMVPGQSRKFPCDEVVRGPELAFPVLLNQLHEGPQILAFLAIGELDHLSICLQRRETHVLLAWNQQLRSEDA